MSKSKDLLELVGTLERTKEHCIYYEDGNCSKGSSLLNGRVYPGEFCHSVNMCLSYMKKGRNKGFLLDAPLLNGPL